MRVVIRILVIVVAAGLGFGGWVLWQNREHPAGTGLRVSGTIETTEVQASFKQPGRLAYRYVTEGDSIICSQALAQLDLSDLLIDYTGRSADVAVAESILAELEHGARTQEIRQAVAVVARMIAAAAEKSNDFLRQSRLYKEGVISSRDYETAQSACEVTQAQVNEQQEILKLLLEGPRRERVDQARAALEQKREALASVRQHLLDATLLSPFSGVVLSKAAEPGEYLMAGSPIITIADLGEVWLRGYVAETDLGRIKLGQHARVFTDAYPGKAYDGHITFISSETEFTPKTVQTTKERVKLVYRIKITLANPAHELKPGMPADADIDLTP